MSAVLPPVAGPAAARDAAPEPSRLRQRLPELLWFGLIGTFYGLVDLSALVEMGERAPRWTVQLQLLATPVVLSLLLLPFWLLTVRSPLPYPRRLWRLAGGAVLASAAMAAVVPSLMRWLSWPTVGGLMREAKGEAAYTPWHWGVYVGDVLSILVVAMGAFVLFDLLRRRRHSGAELRRLQLAQARLTREATTARLAALQAQVEPQFLFDTLVDIEQAYARADAQAPQRMERLIHHLRVALPRLRDGGGASTLAAETELLQSWLAVAQDHWPAPLPLQALWPPPLAELPLPPMVLLPLLQGALCRSREAGSAGPTRVLLQAMPLLAAAGNAQAGAVDGLSVTLSLDCPGACPDAELMSQLAARAQALCNGPVALHCEAEGGTTRFVLELRL